MTPTHWAKKHNKQQILDLLLQNGGVSLEAKKKQTGPLNRKPSKVLDDKTPKTNERKISKRYLLTTMKEDGYYEPMTDAEFEQFKIDNPALAKYFESGEDD